MPMRTSFTSPLGTVMCPRVVAATVLGRSNTKRAGESSVVSLGVTVPRAVNSTLNPSAVRVTLTFSSAERPVAAAPVTGVSAGATITIASSGRKTLSSCFRILPLPRLGLHWARPKICLISISYFMVLHRRGRELFGHFPGQRLAQFVFVCFAENYRIAGNFHDKPIKHGIVFPQKICFVHRIRDDRDHAGLGLDDAFQVDLIDGQAAFAGATTGTTRGGRPHRTNKGIALAGVVEFLGRTLRICGCLTIFDRHCRFGICGFSSFVL